MKALTLWRPWGYCIAHMGKRIENRTWAPPRTLFGQRIAIHQGKSWSPPNDWGELEVDREDPLVHAVGIVATAVVTGVVHAVSHDKFYVKAGAIPGGWSQRQHGDWFNGPFGWVLDEVQPVVPPLVCRGAQGLWNVPADLLEKLS